VAPFERAFVGATDAPTIAEFVQAPDFVPVEEFLASRPLGRLTHDALREVVGGLSRAHNGTVRILEVGARRPEESADYLRVAAPSSYVLADQSRHHLDLAAQRAPGLFEQLQLRASGDQGPTPRLLERADLVVCNQTLHQCADVDAMLREVRGLVKPRGLMVLVETTSASPLADVLPQIALELIGRPEAQAAYRDRVIAPLRNSAIDAVTRARAVGQWPGPDPAMSVDLMIGAVAYRLNYLGHSYGSTTSGKSVPMMAAGTIDNFVMFGSPGSGVRNIDAYGLPEGHVYESSTPYGDAVQGLGPDASYGTNPRKLEGITHLSGDTTGSANYTVATGALSFDNHMSYFDEGTRTSQDFANIIAGIFAFRANSLLEIDDIDTKRAPVQVKFD